MIPYVLGSRLDIIRLYRVSHVGLNQSILFTIQREDGNNDGSTKEIFPFPFFYLGTNRFFLLSLGRIYGCMCRCRYVVDLNIFTFCFVNYIWINAGVVRSIPFGRNRIENIVDDLM